jgi:hypothetical protein
MDEQQALAYVQASAAALGFDLDPARAQRVAQHLQRTAGLAALLEQFELGVEDEPAEVWNPRHPAPGAPS